MNSACFEAIIKKNSSTFILWNYWHINFFQGVTVESINTVFIFAKTTTKINFKKAEGALTIKARGCIVLHFFQTSIFCFTLILDNLEDWGSTRNIQNALTIRVDLTLKEQGPWMLLEGEGAVTDSTFYITKNHCEIPTIFFIYFIQV